MSAPSTSLVRELRPRIIERRARLEVAARALPTGYFADLLAEIDADLLRIDQGSFGICETCHDPIEADRLEHNPLVRFCLDHLSAGQLRAHEQDLELATRIQATLLPATDLAAGDWQTFYRYQPAGVVGGDYCEVVAHGDGNSLFFAVGDVAGKGVAASLLMTHLSAIFRSLLSLDLPLADLIARANRLFCESTPATHFATLAAGRTTPDGVELCNAGHCPPLLLRGGAAEPIEATGVPLGLFCSAPYLVRSIHLAPGDSLVLYSDGITEAQDPAGNPYEEAGLIASLRAHARQDANALVDGVLSDLARFRSSAPQQDDITLLYIRRTAGRSQ